MKSGWAPKVKRHDIIRLYARDAEGIYDEDLIDEVGFGLLARCEDILTVSVGKWRTWREQPPCPDCRTVLDGGPGPDAYERRRRIRPTSIKYECPACGWAGNRTRYIATCRLNGLLCHRGMAPYIWAFVDGFPVARTPQHRMVTIDILLHYLHGSGRYKPIASFLVEGSPEKIFELLDGISHEKWSSHRRQCPRCQRFIFGRRPDGTWQWGDYCSRRCHDGTVGPNDQSRIRARQELRRRRRLRRRGRSS